MLPKALWYKFTQLDYEMNISWNMKYPIGEYVMIVSKWLDNSTYSNGNHLNSLIV